MARPTERSPKAGTNRRATSKSARRRSKAQMMGIRDVAKRAGVNEKRIRMLRLAGLLPEPSPVSCPGKFLWHPLVIERWLRGEIVPAGAKE